MARRSKDTDSPLSIDPARKTPALIFPVPSPEVKDYKYPLSKDLTAVLVP